MKHICEICNQQYDTVEAAEQCELAHKKDDAAKKMQADASAKINDAVNAYVAKYKELPELDLTDENQKILLEALADKVGETFGMLINMLCEDDEDDECDCGCEKCDGSCKNTDAE